MHCGTWQQGYNATNRDVLFPIELSTGNVTPGFITQAYSAVQVSGFITLKSDQKVVFPHDVIVYEVSSSLNFIFIAKCQYTDCTRNVLWCQVHSSHIHSNHKSFNYNSKYK